MDKLWYYAKNGSTDRQGPVPAADLHAQIAQGQLTATDLAWTEGMDNWQPLAQIEEFRPQFPTAALAGTPSHQPPVHAGAATGGIPDGLEGWMSFVGIVTIISGALYCLTCVGIIVGIFMIMAGTALMGAKNALGLFRAVDPSQALFFDKLKGCMLWTGIFYIISIIITIGWLIVYLIVFAGMIAGSR
jgi:hypothetical protein